MDEDTPNDVNEKQNNLLERGILKLQVRMTCEGPLEELKYKIPCHSNPSNL